MSILVLDSDGRCEIDRPYLNKFSQGDVLVNAVWVGHSEPIEITRNEREAFARLTGGEDYSGLIISCGVPTGIQMLEKVRTAKEASKVPVTIL